MSFGKIIKKLRRDADMTQEKLAELLSISPQAVSRWETDSAMPDISLIPPLANLFGVTADYLLEMDQYQKDLRKAEFEEAFREYWRHDDKEKNYEVAVRAVAAYPGNMEYVEWLASAEFYVGSVAEDSEVFNRLLESSAKHYKLVLENTTDSKLYNRVLQGIVWPLHMLGRKTEAKEYAMRIENDHDRDSALCWCLEGEEKICHRQKVAERCLNEFLFQLKVANYSIAARDAIEQILQLLFPDGNYQYYHNILQYNAMDKAFMLCKENRYDEVIAALRTARFHAEEMVKYGQQTQYRFTAPFFDRVAGETIMTDRDATDLDDFIDSLNNHPCFDPLRDREDFKTLYLK